MGKLEETKPVSKLTLKLFGNSYVISDGGGITPGVPIPADTVDTEAIIDGAVEMQDLNDDVKKNMTHSYDSKDEGIVLGGLVSDKNE